MSIISLEKLVSIAREKSPFYRELYAGVPDKIQGIESLPIVDQKEFWDANNLERNTLLTAEPSDGIIFKSGGTTGAPKFSIYTREEWATFTRVFARGMDAAGIRRGERIANLFYGGSLYASFLFIYQSLEYTKNGTVQLPLGGGTDPLEVLRAVNDFEVCTLAGVPTFIMTVAHAFAENRSMFPKIAIKRILFGGESMFADQRKFLAEVFSGVKIQSIGYASVDAGLLGYAAENDQIDEHRVFSEASIVEIIDEQSGEVIREPGKVGKLLITNLTRSIMPIIRYPAGDRAEWLDSPHVTDSRFALRGRSEEAARVGPVSIYYQDVGDVLLPFRKQFGVQSYQLFIRHFNHRDGLVVRIAVSNPRDRTVDDSQVIIDALAGQRKMLKEWAETGKIHQCVVEWVEPSELAVNPRTGKMKRIVDERFGG